MWGQLLGAIGQKAVGSIGSQLGGVLGSKLGGGDTAAQGPGVQINNEPPPTQMAQPDGKEGGPADGSAISKLLEGVSEAGVSSIVDPLKARASGKANRKYLESSFPELSSWERAGASATQAGSQISEQRRQRDQMKAQFKQQKELQAQNIAMQERINERNLQNQLVVTDKNNATSLQSTRINSDTSRFNTQENLSISRAKLPSEIRKLESDALRTDQDRQRLISEVRRIDTQTDRNRMLNRFDEGGDIRRVLLTYFNNGDEKQLSQGLAALAGQKAGNYADGAVTSILGRGKAGSRGPAVRKLWNRSPPKPKPKKYTQRRRKYEGYEVVE